MPATSPPTAPTEIELDAIGRRPRRAHPAAHQPRRRRPAELHHESARSATAGRCRGSSMGARRRRHRDATDSSTTSPTEGPHSGPSRPTTRCGATGDGRPTSFSTKSMCCRRHPKRPTFWRPGSRRNRSGSSSDASARPTRRSHTRGCAQRGERKVGSVVSPLRSAWTTPLGTTKLVVRAEFLDPDPGPAGACFRVLDAGGVGRGAGGGAPGDRVAPSCAGHVRARGPTACLVTSSGWPIGRSFIRGPATKTLPIRPGDDTCCGCG